MRRACEDFEELLSANLDGQLDAEEQSRLKEHLQSCYFCRDEAKAIASTRRQLHNFRSREKGTPVPGPVWQNAVRAWDAQDARKLRRFEWRALAVAAMLLLAFLGVVWARLQQPLEFPVQAALADYAQIRKRPPRPQLATQDPDAANHWLEGRVGANLPPMDLRLSRNELIGASVISTHDGPLTRLLFNSRDGLIALYEASGRTQYGDLSPVQVGGEEFRRNATRAGETLYGWSKNGVGYAVVTHQTARQVKNTLLDAERNSDQPSR